MKIKLIAIFIVIYGIFIFVHTQNKNKHIDLALDKQIKILKVHYDLTKDYFLTDVKSISLKIKEDKRIRDIFSKAQNASKEQKDILRKKLYKLLAPMNKRIQSRGVAQWQFVFPNNISFLRMHKPEKYGDDLIDTRYSYKYVNETKKAVEGFEQGKSAHAFRYVFPYYDKQKNYLGAVELSLSSYALQNKLLNINKIHSHFLVKRNNFNENFSKTKSYIAKYIPSIEHKDYLLTLLEHSNMKELEYSKDTIIAPIKDKIAENIALKKPFSLYVQLKDTAKVLAFLPIKNIKEKEVVAYIVVYINNDNIYNIIKTLQTSRILIFIILVFLFYFIYKNVEHKQQLQREIEKLTIDNKARVIMEYEGEFTQTIIVKYIDIIEDNIRNMGIASNISIIFSEQYQNILNYAKSEDELEEEVVSTGYINIKLNQNSYSVTSKNIISLKDKEKIEPKLVEIQSLDREGIRKRYRKLRKTGENTHEKGGGFGLYLIAKQCSYMDYKFVKISNDRYEFIFTSYIGLKK